MAEVILAIDVRNKLYFTWHHNEGLVLYTPNGRYQLTIAAGEDLLDNLQVNVEYARKAAEAGV